MYLLDLTMSVRVPPEAIITIATIIVIIVHTLAAKCLLP
jgi:hypothetical protein